MTRHIHFRFEDAVLESDLPGQAKILALAMNRHVDEQGRCWVSNKRLMALASMKKTALQRWKRMLVDEGWIAIVENAHGGRPGDVPTYEVRFPLVSTVSADGAGRDGPVLHTGTTLPAHGEGPCPPTGTEQTLEQTSEQTTPPVDVIEGRSIDAWLTLDLVCQIIDGSNFAELPRTVRLESHRCVTVALETSSTSAVLDRLRPPDRVRSKSGLVLSMARNLADDPPGDLVTREASG